MFCPARVSALLLAVVGLTASAAAPAQNDPECDPFFALNLTVRDVGVSLGDSRRTIGARVNYGDRCLQAATGVNATLFPPFQPDGTVTGLALGLPLTGSARLQGAAVGVGLFFGNAGDVRGRATGLLLGGVATVSESPARGLLVGGLGTGVGAPAAGVLVGGITAVSTARGRGLFLGGAVAGTGGPSVGLLAGGLAAGTTDRLTGAALSPGVVGVGTRLVGLGVGGLGVGGRDAIQGLAVAGAALGTRHLTGVGVAGAYTYIRAGGTLRGATVAAANHVRGTQRGLTIGLLNYARELHGVQVGLINVARNNPVWATILPGMNVNL
jgi:hypothetical protein